METTPVNAPVINTAIYSQLGDRWYKAYDDPIALLRAESKLRNKWVQEKIQAHFGATKSKILDIGCGGGFLSNVLALDGHHVSGLDLSPESIEVARLYDSTKSVNYLSGDAQHLPFEPETFDVCCAMDFLEHVEDPASIIREASRVLKPGGLFFFHTFNRNPLSWLFAAKGLEWFVKNSPPHIHLYRLFIKPSELKQILLNGDLTPGAFIGLRPRFFKKAFWQLLATGVVPEDFEFVFTPSLAIGYTGVAEKNRVTSKHH